MGFSWCVLFGCLVVSGWGLPLRPTETKFEMIAGLPLRNLDQLEALFWRVADPEDPEYLKHRQVPELAELIGADQQELDTIRDWFLAQGADASSVRVSPLRDTVTAAFSAQPANWSSNGIPLAASHPVALDFLLRRDFDAPLLAAPVRKSVEPEAMYTISQQKKAYGIDVDLQASNETTLQMVWGPGTFGYSKAQLEVFKLSQCPHLNMDKVKFDTENHGESGGDNYGEGNLDTKMISAFGLNVETLVSNTNASSSTEEGNGFGQALLDFITQLSSRPTVPQVLSLSLGSLSGYSCDLLCNEASKEGHSLQECQDFLQEQRQVCMFLSQDQVARINVALQVLGVRGVSIFGSSGDGGSHFSFGPFSGGPMADVLNDISCKFQIPVFPASSPYIVAVGGTQWKGGDPSTPEAWPGSGGGFSWQFAMPSHQVATVDQYLSSTSGLPPLSSFNRSGRAYPDMSAVSLDGTSQSSPTVAGIWSLLMDHRLNMGLPPLGFLGTRMYKVATEFPGEAFESVSSGNTQTSCDNGFPAADGWDPVTGWGRPVWAGMLKHFGSD